MNFPWRKTSSKTIALSLALWMCGAPQLLAQSSQNAPPANQPTPQPQSSPPPASPQNQPADTTAGNAQSQPGTAQSQPGDGQSQTPAAQPGNQGVEVDPSKGPLQPVVPNAGQLPNAPSSAQPPQSASQAAQPASQDQQKDQQKKNQEPQGTAVAGEARTAGGPASKPAGTAIAPAKQRQVRSLLFKLGLIAAGGAAVGTVYALTRSTSSTPPNATMPGATQAH